MEKNSKREMGGGGEDRGDLIVYWNLINLFVFV